MSPSWIWSDKITNERVARVGDNHFISNKGEWNNCFSKFSNRVLPPIFSSTIFQSGKFLNLERYFPYDVKLRLLAHSRSFLANQKATNAIARAENLLKVVSQTVKTLMESALKFLISAQTYQTLSFQNVNAVFFHRQPNWLRILCHCSSFLSGWHCVFLLWKGKTKL